MLFGLCVGMSSLAVACQYERTLTFATVTPRADSIVGISLSPKSMGVSYQHINADGSDLRFTAANGTTPLSYWIESWNPAGQSKVWVKVPTAGTAAIKMKYGNPTATSASAGAGVFHFFDDFNNGVWTKYAGNPVMTRTEPWEARAICESSLLHEDGVFKMWYMGCATVSGTNAALGYATSPDGLNWTKAAGNPILQDPNQSIIRTTVIKNQGIYYLFASDYQWNSAAGNIYRWTSTDGLNWTDKTVVLQPSATWENHFHNIGVTIDEQNTWHMLYSTDGPMGYAQSTDGLNWTKHPTPVISGIGGGDPYLTKIGDTFYAWHSQSKDHDELLIYCRKSADMVNWQMIGTGPALNYSQPWERGIGRSEVSWDRHLTDAELIEHDGKVWMHYQGAQNPFGVATFDGTMAQLAQRSESNPPLKQWAASHYGSVENNQLKISDNVTRNRPLHENVTQFSDQKGYTVECRAQMYAGYHTQSSPEGWSSETQCVTDEHPQLAVVMRYCDDNNMACFRLINGSTTYYEERTGGTWSTPISIGPNNAYDGQWHRWRIEVQGSMNTLYIDDVLIGSCASSAALCNRTDLMVGVSSYNAFAAFDDLRVTNGGLFSPEIVFGTEVP